MSFIKNLLKKLRQGRDGTNINRNSSIFKGLVIVLPELLPKKEIHYGYFKTFNFSL